MARSRPLMLFMSAILLWPVAAFAHGVSPAISGFYAGGMTVLVAPEDVMQWISLCAFAALQPPARAGWAAEALAAGLVAGFLAGTLGWFPAAPAWAGAAGLLAVGGLLLSGMRVAPLLLVALAAIIGASHGVHDGQDLAGRTDTLALAAGIGITAYVIMVIGISAFVLLAARIGSVRMTAVRAFGSWVVAIALMIGAFEIRGH